MRDSALQKAHNLINPYNRQYDGYYTYPEIDMRHMNLLIASVQNLAGITVDVNRLASQYKLNTPEGRPLTLSTVSALHRITGTPLGPMMTPAVAAILRTELDKLFEIVILSRLFYEGPLKSS